MGVNSFLCRFVHLSPLTQADDETADGASPLTVHQKREKSERVGQRFNMCGRTACPVLVSSRHFPGECESERVVQPMKWGLVPAWHKGDPYRLDYDTNNCRAEGMLTKRTYSGPLNRGKRCVILADGFFEWKRPKDGKKGEKQPFFIYFPQQSESPDCKFGVKPETKPDVKTESTAPDIKTESTEPDIKTESTEPDTKTESTEPDTKTESTEPDVKTESTQPDIKTESTEPDVKTEPAKPDDKTELAKPDIKIEPASADQLEEEEWTGRRLLTMAGVFDVWTAPDGAPLYSYSVITVDASPAISCIHHRMPAILSTEEEISDWLDFADVPLSKAVKAIHPSECVSMHMVSPVVNNSRHNTPACVAPYQPEAVKKSASSSMMLSWLSRAKPQPQDSASQPKKPKL